jgi:hypothetical protein
VATAHYWQRKPSELGLCEPEQDAAVMKAYMETVKDMEAYEMYLASKPKGK